MWLRLLGRETVRNQAFEELKQLPANHPFLPATLELLYNLQLSLGKQQNLEPEDRELIMRLAPLYQQDRELAKQEGRQEGRQEGLQQGLQQGEERLVLRLIDRLFGTIDSSLVEKVRSLSVDELENLGVALLDFSDVADLENWFVQQEQTPQAEAQN
jgi:predicted transposase YdaD